MPGPATPRPFRYRRPRAARPRPNVCPLRLLLRQRAELLAQPKGIPTVKSLRDLAAGEAVETHAIHADRLAGGGDALKLALVGAGQHPAGDHLVALGNDIFHLKVEIGEGGVPLLPLRPKRFLAGAEIGIV